MAPKALAKASKAEKKAKKAEKTGVDALKKPMSAFMIYCNARRSTVAAEHQGKGLLLSITYLIELKLTQVT